MPSPYTALPMDDTHASSDAGHIQHHDDLAHWLNLALFLGDSASSRSSRLIARTFEPRFIGTGGTPTAGTVYLNRVPAPRSATVTNVEVVVTTGGSGATALANCFFGLYDPTTLARLAVSADASSLLTTSGTKVVPLTAPYAYTGAFGNDLLIGLVIGTQATTALQLARSSGAGNATGLNFDYTAPAYLSATANTGASALPATASGLASGSNLWLLGLS